MPLHVKVVDVLEGPSHDHVGQDLQLRSLNVSLAEVLSRWNLQDKIYLVYLDDHPGRDDLGRGGKFPLGHHLIDKLGEPHHLHLNMIIIRETNCLCVESPLTSSSSILSS